MSRKPPIIAIVGRPNVGKSTLFNRVYGERKAVVEDIPGVTRDRNYAFVEKFSIPFSLIDTGGFEAVVEEEMQAYIVEQAMVAAEEADLILVLFDGKAGLQPGDSEVMGALRKFDKPIRYVVNKCDGLEQVGLTADFYSLGIDKLYNLSALHGRGVREFIEDTLQSFPFYENLKQSFEAKIAREKYLADKAKAEWDAAQKALEGVEDADETAEDELEGDLEEGSLSEGPELSETEETSFAPVFFSDGDARSELDYVRSNKVLELSKSTPNPVFDGSAVRDLDAFEDAEGLREFVPDLAEIKVAIIGRPNAGKSTLLNTLTGEQRAVTSPVAGTTRDALDLKIRRDGQDYVLIDTAGLRKKSKISDQIERYSVIRALNVVSACDVALVVIDGVRGPSEQDAKIIGLAHDQGKGIVIVVNKWDLVKKDHRTVKEYEQKIRVAFKFSPYAPIVFVSALTGRRCPKVIETVRLVARERVKSIKTSYLNMVLKKAMRRGQQPTYRGQAVKLFFAAQVSSSPPRLALYFNYPKEVHFSYLRFLKNAIRAEFGFHGTDIKLVCRRRE